MIKFRPHHNNTGYRQIKNGKIKNQVERIAKRFFKGKIKPNKVEKLLDKISKEKEQ